ncbi:MAG: VOC family protein, partial [Anaerolineae bacterium]|nr:VOC family protein [Anaerolineae bacterium]
KLGFNHGMTMPGPDGAPNFAIVDLSPQAMFGLQLDANPPAHRGDGVIFMVYVNEATDIDAYYADVQSKGVTIVEPIKTEYWGDRIFSVKDPDGYYLTLTKTVKQMSMDEIVATQS